MTPFISYALPLKELDYKKLISHIGPANRALARYDGLMQSLINPALMLSPLTNNEAVLSSKIEGTQATIDEVLKFEAGISFDDSKSQDIQEVLNYRKTLIYAKEAIDQRPISLSLIKEMHGSLMDSVRGARKDPGNFRDDQNWIGAPGSKIEDASYVPPPPYTIMGHLDNLVSYINYEEIDALVQTAIIHAQFEMIHPFKDGNGRLGRLLIPLFLYKKKVLSSPSFYLSEFLESNRDEYYEKLGKISKSGEWENWIIFFLSAVKHQSDNNIKRVKMIQSLYEAMKTELTEITHSQYSIKMLDCLFTRPIFQSSDFINIAGIPKQSVSSLLKKITDAGIVTCVQKSSGRKSGVYAFIPLLKCSEAIKFESI